MFMNENRVLAFASTYGIEKEIEGELRPLKNQLDRVQKEAHNSYPKTFCGVTKLYRRA